MPPSSFFRSTLAHHFGDFLLHVKGNLGKEERRCTFWEVDGVTVALVHSNRGFRIVNVVPIDSHNCNTPPPLSFNIPVEVS